MQALAYTLMLGVALFAFVAAVGLVRMPDVFTRMHAASKAGALSCGLMLLGFAAHFQSGPVLARALLTIFFLLLTAPVAAHAVGRAAWRAGTPLRGGTHIDADVPSPPPQESHR